MFLYVAEVRLDPSRPGEIEKGLHEKVIPWCQGYPGFVTGYWTASDDGTTGYAVVVFDTEEAARGALRASEDDMASTPADAPVTLIRHDVYQVLAHA